MLTCILNELVHVLLEILPENSSSTFANLILQELEERRETESAADIGDSQQLRPRLSLKQLFAKAYEASTPGYFYLPFTGDFTGEF